MDSIRQQGSARPFLLLAMTFAVLCGFLSCTDGGLEPDPGGLPEGPDTPVISRIEPDSGPPGQTVSIFGSNFGIQAADNIVRFKEVEARILAVRPGDEDEIEVIVPDGLPAAQVPVTVEVESRVSNAALFTVTPRNYTVGTGPAWICSGDFNRDGLQDLATANSGSNDVAVLFTTPEGDFSDPSFLGLPSAPWSVDSGDFNEDGNPDLAVAHAGFRSVCVSIFFLNGRDASSSDIPVPVEQWTCTPWASARTGDRSSDSYGSEKSGTGGMGALAAEDFDRDGNLDLALVDTWRMSLSVLYGDGSGGFSASMTVFVKEPTYALEVEDFNEDGFPDLVTAGFGGNNVFLAMNRCDRSFSEAVAIPEVQQLNAPEPEGRGTKVTSIEAGEFNQDGHPDLAVAVHPDPQGKLGIDGMVYVLFGNGAGGFSLSTPFFPRVMPISMRAGHFNEDSYMDLATTGVPNALSILFGEGPDSFSTAKILPAGAWPQYVMAEDLDGDENPDLVTANRQSDNVSVFLGNGKGDFSEPTGFAVGVAPYAVVASDFNGDGDLDLANANLLSETISVLLGNGQGAFSEAEHFRVCNLPDDANEYDTCQYMPISVALGDFNLDGCSDLATANLLSHGVSVLLGGCNGEVAFQQVLATSGQTPCSIVSADFDRNGTPDLAVLNNQPGEDKRENREEEKDLTSTVTVFYNDGTGGFTEHRDFVVGPLPFSIRAADFNGDGWLDLASAHLRIMADAGLSFDSVTVLLGDGAGGFGSPQMIGIGDPSRERGLKRVAEDPVCVVPADFDGDGNPDLVSVNSPGVGFYLKDAGTLSVLLGRGDGQFKLTDIIDLPGSSPFDAEAGDFNDDHIPDLAVVTLGNELIILLGEGNGRFSMPKTNRYRVGLVPLDIALGDFTEDGNLDIAIANGLTNDLTVLYGNGEGEFFSLESQQSVQSTTSRLLQGRKARD